MPHNMKRIRSELADRLTVSTERGWRVDIQPGEIDGLLDLAPFVDPQVCSQDMGYFRVTLLFRASTGECFQYSSILPPSILWPGGEILCQPSDEMTEPDLALQTLFDTREPFEVRLIDGQTMNGVMKYVDSRVQVAIRPTNLDVRLTFYWAAAQSYRTVAFQPPLSSLLWKTAPLFSADDFSVQGANYVDITRWEGAEIDVLPSPVIAILQS